jgi:DNA polymerase-3 subunit epsilon
MLSYWPSKQVSAICTMQLAKEKGHKKTNLNALCKHYGIDVSRRVIHGALTDAELLAKLYLEMTR